LHPRSGAWLAWQFNRQDSGRGVIQAFRRAEAKETTRASNSADSRLHGRYRVTNSSTIRKNPARFSGKELMNGDVELAVSENQEPESGFTEIGNRPR